jgi:hypothetical protein
MGIEYLDFDDKGEPFVVGSGGDGTQGDTVGASAGEDAEDGAADGGTQDEDGGEAAGAGAEDGLTDGEGESGNGEEDADPEDGESESEDDDTGVEDEKKRPTPEEARANAARRKKEELRRLRAENERYRAQLQELSQGTGAATPEPWREFLGKVNPYNGQPITNRAEYEAYQTGYRADQRRQSFKKLGLDDEGAKALEEQLRSMVQELPEVRQAREAIGAVQAAQQQELKAKAQAEIRREVELIAKLDPAIKTMDDIAHHPSAEKVLAKFDAAAGGLTLSEAWRLVNGEAISKQRAQAAAAHAQVQQEAKAHLKKTPQRAGIAATIPAETLEAMKAMSPGKTVSEYQKLYEQIGKELGDF